MPTEDGEKPGDARESDVLIQNSTWTKNGAKRDVPRKLQNGTNNGTMMIGRGLAREKTHDLSQQFTIFGYVCWSQDWDINVVSSLNKTIKSRTHHQIWCFTGGSKPPA